MGIVQNISRHIVVHANVCAALPLCGREKPLALGKPLNVQNVNLPLCVTSVVLGTAAQKSWLCCWKLTLRVTYHKKETLFPTKGLVSKETKKKSKNIRKEHVLLCHFT